MARGLIELLKEDLLEAGVPQEVIDALFGIQPRQAQDNISRVTAEVRSLFKAIGLQFTAAPKQELGYFLSILMDVARDLGLTDAGRIPGKLHTDRSTQTSPGTPTGVELEVSKPWSYTGRDKRKGASNNIGVQCNLLDDQEDESPTEAEEDLPTSSEAEEGHPTTSEAEEDLPTPSEAAEEDIPPLEGDEGAVDPTVADLPDQGPRGAKRKPEEEEETLTTIEEGMIPLMFPGRDLTPAQKREIALRLLDVSKKFKKCEYLCLKM